jgi:hypothetical protein
MSDGAKKNTKVNAKLTQEISNDEGLQFNLDFRNRNALDTVSLSGNNSSIISTPFIFHVFTFRSIELTMCVFLEKSLD